MAARGMAVAAALLASQASASALKVLYRFTGHGDGADPSSALVLDRRGNLFGVASQGGAGNGAVIYEVSPAGGGGWGERAIHAFPTRASGVLPFGALTLGRDGALLGTTSNISSGAGDVFALSPVGAGFSYATLVHIPGSHSPRGSFPTGRLLPGAKGEIFGVTAMGGDESGAHPCDCGLVYEVTRNGGGWSENVLSAFKPLPDGANPAAGLTAGPAGFLFGTTSLGGTGRCQDGSGVVVVGCGTLFTLAGQRGAWRRATLHGFGERVPTQPSDPLTLGPDGALYGFSLDAVYRFAPPGSPGARWTPSIIHHFAGGLSGAAPVGAPVLDARGNLYGITRAFGLDGPVVIFRLSPAGGNRAGPWTKTELYSVRSGNFGDQPAGGLVRAADGTLYGAIGPGAGGSLGYVFALKP